MQNINRGTFIVFSGPSGVGKGTILNKIIGRRKNLKVSVSYTTRKPRIGEIDGINYHFVSEDEFLKIVKDGDMLEYAKYCGNYYGTPRKSVEEEIENGNNVILEIEVQGGEQILKKYPESVGIFVIPPSLNELRNRLTLRALDNEEVISKRIDEAKREIEFSKFYNYIVINEDVEKCASNILKIVDSQNMRFDNMQKVIQEVLNDA